MDLFYVFSHGDVVLMTTFLMLISMSIISWYIIIWKCYRLTSRKKSINSLQNDLSCDKDFSEIVRSSKKYHLNEIISTIKELPHNFETYPDDKKKDYLSLTFGHMLDVIRIENEKALTILASIGSSAPFIGLFGTVWGIYNALMKISEVGNASLNVVAGPIGEALIATAVGLFAAIPAVLAYNGFVRFNRTIMQDYRHVSEKISFKIILTQDLHADKPNLKLVTGE